MLLALAGIFLINLIQSNRKEDIQLDGNELDQLTIEQLNQIPNVTITDSTDYGDEIIALEYSNECFLGNEDPRNMDIAINDTFQLADKTIKAYAKMCEYTTTSVIYEVYQGDERIRLFSGIYEPHSEHPPIDQSRNLIYLRTRSTSFIYNAKTNTVVDIDRNLQCNTLRAQWYDGYLLLTSQNEFVRQYSREEANGNIGGEIYTTSNCIFDQSGNKLYEFAENIKFGAVAPGYYIVDDFGLKLENNALVYYINDEIFTLK